MSEIERTPDVKCYPCYETNCIECGESITMWHNGGELDTVKCCGYTYSLENARIDFVVKKEVYPASKHT